MWYTKPSTVPPTQIRTYSLYPPWRQLRVERVRAERQVSLLVAFMATISPTIPLYYSHHRRFSYGISPDQIRRRVVSDEALLRTITTLEADAKLTAANASRAVNEAQTALLAAHAWLSSAMATYESYRLEHLRLAEVVARSRSLLRLVPSSLPDELIIQIAELCLEDARERLLASRQPHSRVPSDESRQESVSAKSPVYSVYPFSLSQICQRWRSAILSCPRLWAYKNNLAIPTSTPLADLIALRAGTCTVDTMWTVNNQNSSSPTSTTSTQHPDIDKWRTLQIVMPTGTTNSFPFSGAGKCQSLTSLRLFASAQTHAPLFATSHLSGMPQLTKLELVDVHLVAPPPYRHNLPIELSIRYDGVISFRAKDMADIAIVFPKLRKFNLYIRGPYINRKTSNIANSNDANGNGAPNNNNNNSTPLPFSFPELESLDISAKDLSHSLTQFQGAFLPRLSYLRLRDNGLSASSTFFNHLIRSRVPLATLAITDISPNTTKLIKLHRGIQTLQLELNKSLFEILRTFTSTTAPSPTSAQTSLPTPPSANIVASPASPFLPFQISSAEKETLLAFPNVSKICLRPPVAGEGSIGKLETSTLQALASIIRERNAYIFDSVKSTMGVPRTLSEKIGAVLEEKAVLKSPLPDPPSVKETTEKAAVEEEKQGQQQAPQPMTSEDTLVDVDIGPPADTLTLSAFPVPPASLPPPTSSSPRTPIQGLPTQRRMPSIDIPKWSPTMSRASFHVANKASMEQTHTRSRRGSSAVVDKRRAWNGVAMVPILEVEYTPLRSKGRVAMEEVYDVLVESRKMWMGLGFEGLV
ncbi:hypothetical protein CPB86DRAFT_114494 [Serendipita vermifera]|nr:hypothetical protein CPB86DRAFT_114494 [Serendipita vermifera]